METLLLGENKSFPKLLRFELQLIICFVYQNKQNNPHGYNRECLFPKMLASFPSIPLNGLADLLWWSIKFSSDVPQWVTNTFFSFLEIATAFLSFSYMPLLRWLTWLFICWSYSIVKSGPLPFLCFPPMWEHGNGNGRKLSAVFGWHSLMILYSLKFPLVFYTYC